MKYEDLRMTALASDLKRIAAGWCPDIAALAHAPLLEDWHWVFRPDADEAALAGRVEGHPRFPDGHHIVTSPIMAAGITGRWVRTHSRFYRLGRERTDA